MKRFITFFATGCWSGKIPFAPGTFGAIVGMGLYWLVKDLPPMAYFAFVAAFVFFAIWVSSRAQIFYGETDPQQIVIDEMAGILVTMLFHRHDYYSILIAGFLFFRIFDIAKPWPVSWAEKRFTDGRGIVLDDVLAGVYANAALWVVEALVPHLAWMQYSWIVKHSL